MSSPIIEIDNLSLKIPPHKRLLSGASLSIEAGETVALMGPSGSGKTTLALTLMGLASKVIADGQIRILGQDWLAFPSKEQAHMRRHSISMIFQDPTKHLNPFFTLKQQMIEVLKSLKKDSHTGLKQSLGEVGLSQKQYLKAYPHELSGGEQQRVLMALALLCDPQLLIADEPTAALDFTLKIELLQRLKSVQKERGLSLLLITHDSQIAQKMAHRVYTIRDEKIHLV